MQIYTDRFIVKSALRRPACAAGGAISANKASTVQIISSTFTENQAENGGAVYINVCGKATLADNTFASNKANKQGGGLFQTKCSGMNYELQWHCVRQEMTGTLLSKCCLGVY